MTWVCGLVSPTFMLVTTNWLDHCHPLLDCGLVSNFFMFIPTSWLDPCHLLLDFGQVSHTFLFTTISWLDHCHPLLDCGQVSHTLMLTTTSWLELYPSKLPIGHPSNMATFISTPLMEPCLPLATSFAQRMEQNLLCGLIVVKFSVAAALNAAQVRLFANARATTSANNNNSLFCYGSQFQHTKKLAKNPTLASAAALFGSHHGRPPPINPCIGSLCRSRSIGDGYRGGDW
jgi:hypothetical protein